MSYIYKEILKFEKDKLTIWDKLKLNLEYYKFMLFFSFHKIILKMDNLFFKSKEEKEEEQNAEIVFEYLH
jgi:hypothetical protein